MPKSGKPNILVIWGDDIGISNLELLFARILMGWRRPPNDRPQVAKEVHDVHRFPTANSPAPRAARPSSPGRASTAPASPKSASPAPRVGMQERIVTIAACLNNQCYATGQFGKNHLGDLNSMLPTNHGFDEFFGNLYHLNAEGRARIARLSQRKGFSRTSAIDSGRAG